MTQSACAVLYYHLCPVWPYDIFAHIPVRTRFSGEKIYWTSNCVFSTKFARKLSHSEKNSARYYKCSRSLCEVPPFFFLSDLNETCVVWTYFPKIIIYQNFVSIRQVRTELFHTDRLTDMTKWIVDLHSFENVPKNYYKGWNFNSGNYLFTTDTK